MIKRTPTMRFYMGLGICILWAVWLYSNIRTGTAENYFWAKEVGFWKIIIAFIPLIAGVVLIAPFFCENTDRNSRE